MYYLVLIAYLTSSQGSSIHTSNITFGTKETCEYALLEAEKANRNGYTSVHVHGFCARKK